MRFFFPSGDYVLKVLNLKKIDFGGFRIFLTNNGERAN